jgi:predicted Zn-dependent peptidase
VILSEIACQDDTPDDLVHILSGLNYWPDHPLGRPILGTSQSVTELDRQTILDHLARAYQPQRLVVVAVGNLEHERLLELMAPSLDKSSNGKPWEQRTPPQPSPGLHVYPRELEQAHAVLSLPAPDGTSPERFAAGLLNTVLGGTMSSRLFQEVREKRGLAYAVYSYLHSYCDLGMLGMYLGVQPGRMAEALKVVREVLHEMAARPLGDQEMDEAKDHLKSSILLASENPESRMSRLARNEIGFGREIPYQETMDGIFAVTPDDIRDLAGRMLDQNQMGITVLGPADQDKLAGALGL